MKKEQSSTSTEEPKVKLALQEKYNEEKSCDSDHRANLEKIHIRKSFTEEIPNRCRYQSYQKI